MDSKQILEIFHELITNKYKKYFSKVKEIEDYISQKNLSSEDTALLVNMLINDEIFAWLDFVSSKIEYIADNTQFFINTITTIISKVKDDLAQGSFQAALIKLGEDKPDLSLKIYDNIITSSKDKSVISYSGLILGGVGRVKPEKIREYIVRTLKTEKIHGMPPVDVAVTKAVRVMIHQKKKLDDKDLYFEVLRIVSDVKNSESLKSDAIHLNFELFKFNKKVCFYNLINLISKNSTDSLRYQVADRLWVFGLGDTKKEFELIEILSTSNNKNVLNRVAYYLGKNNAKDKEKTFEIYINLIKKDVLFSELDYLFKEMMKSDFDFYYHKIEEWIKKETDLKILYSVSHLIRYFSEKNENIETKIKDLTELILERQKKFHKFWEHIIKELSTKQKIHNWTVFSGYIGEDFTAVYKREKEYVEIDAPSARSPIKIRKHSFQNVYQYWSQYLNGKVRRGKLRDITRHSKYIISIMHQFEHLIYN